MANRWLKIVLSLRTSRLRPRGGYVIGVALALVASVLLPTFAAAVGGSGVTASGPDIGKGLYRETWIDMSVKAPGGMASVVRSWEGDEWVFNPALSDLTIEGGAGGASHLKRGSVSYSAFGEGAERTYRSDAGKLIRETATGYLWRDMQGDWIEYDQTGRALAFGNHATKLVDVERDASGRISGFRDAAGLVVITFVYGAGDELEEARDYTGRTVGYAYTGGVLSKVTDVRGREWNFEYQGGWLSRITDPDGRFRDLTYNASGRLLRIADELGTIAEYDYAFDSRRGEYYFQQKDGAGGVSESTYDEEGRLVSELRTGRLVSSTRVDGKDLLVTDEDGHATRYESDVLGRITRIEYATGREVSFGYHEDLELTTRFVDERGSVRELQRDAKGNITQITEASGTPEERVTLLGYDTFGQRTSMTQVVDGAAGDRSAQLQYDSHGNLERVVDAEGGIHLAQYSVRGAVTQLTDPRGKVWVWEFDPAGNVTLARDPSGTEKHWEYDGAGNLTLYRDEADAVTRFEYDARNDLTATVDPLGHRWLRHYDERSLLTAIVDPEGREERFEYALDESLISLPDGYGGQATVEYFAAGTEENPGSESLVRFINPESIETRYLDARGRQVRLRIEHLGGVREERWSYDDANSKITYTRFDGAETVYRFDALGRLDELRLPDLSSISFEHDKWGQSQRVTDAAGHATSYLSDKLGRLVTVSREGGRETSYTYDPAGLRQSRIGPDGRKLVYHYDDVRNLVRVDGYATAADADPERSQTFSHDPRGELVGFATSDVSGTFVFDPAGRRISDSVDYGGFQLGNVREYHDNGLLKTIASSGAPAISYGYDPENRPSLISIPNGGSVAMTEYSSGGAQRIQYPGGTTSSRTYDGLLRLVQQQVRDPAGNLQSDRSHVYGAAGLLSEAETDQQNSSYSYDALDQLTTADLGAGGVETYTYDAAGNRQPGTQGAAAWTYSDRNELLSTSDVTYEYDPAGRMTKRTESSEIRTFEYGAFGRLRRVRDEGGSVLAEYGYDAFGQRVWKEVAGVRRYFHYSESGLVAEADASGGVDRRYIYAPESEWGTEVVFLQNEGGASSGFYAIHSDAITTPTVLTDSTGAVVWRATHSAFGEALIESDPDGDGNVIDVAMRFPGQYFDQETGLHYNRFRYYDPEIGRYISADPIGQFGIVQDADVTPGPRAPGANVPALPQVPTPQIAVGDASSVVAPGLFALTETMAIVAQEANLYLYAFNDPVNAFDAEGLRVKAALCAAAGAAVQACKALKGCKGNESCVKLRAKQAAWSACAGARTFFSTRCKGGPDRGHRRAIQSWLGAAAKCARLAKQKNCSCFGF